MISDGEGCETSQIHLNRVFALLRRGLDLMPPTELLILFDSVPSQMLMLVY